MAHLRVTPPLSCFSFLVFSCCPFWFSLGKVVSSFSFFLHFFQKGFIAGVGIRV